MDLKIAWWNCHLSAPASKAKPGKVTTDFVSVILNLLDSDVDKAFLEITSQGQSVADITRCQMLGKLMEDRLYAHQATQDSIIVSEATVKAVRQLQKTGVYFTLASGRPPRAMLDQIAQLDIKLPTAAFNGAVLVDANGRYLESHHLPVEAVRHSLKVLAAHPVDLWVFADDEWYLRDPNGPMVAHEKSALGYGPV